MLTTHGTTNSLMPVGKTQGASKRQKSSSNNGFDQLMNRQLKSKGNKTLARQQKKAAAKTKKVEQPMAESHQPEQKPVLKAKNPVSANKKVMVQNTKPKTDQAPLNPQQPVVAPQQESNPATELQQLQNQQATKAAQNSLKVPAGLRTRMNTNNQVQQQMRHGDFKIQGTANINQSLTKETGLNSKLVELRSTLNQLKDVIDNQNNTIASLVENKESSFLQEVGGNKQGTGFSLNQSVEQKNSEVLFWPGSDIDGLELKAAPPQEFVKDPAINDLIAKAQMGMQKTDLQIGKAPGLEKSASKDLGKMVADQFGQTTVSPEQNLNKVMEQAGGQKTGTEEGLGFENFFPGNGQVQNNVEAAESMDFSQNLDVVGKEEGQQNKIENMNNIVRQVRTVIRDGGGEMNVELMPEGLGKVQLKVAVESGKVNVEMMADNDMAKKALEESLNEMKSSLESQKLIVDNLKVDMSKDYQKDYSQQESFLQEQANRDFAQQFMENFNNERDERVTGLFDGFRNYISEPNSPELALNSQRAFFGEGKGKSLNLKV